MGDLALAIDEIRTELATAGPEIFQDVADIEKQGSTTGTGSDTPGWTVWVNDWPCKFEAKRETTGAREDVDSGMSQAYAYSFTGPYVHAGVTLVNVIKKGMRVRLTSRTIQPEMVFLIEDVDISGILLRLVAKATD